jgi:urease alpha subunit
MVMRSCSVAARPSATGWVKRRSTQRSGCLDLVITNVVVMDPIIGIVKADIGVRNGLIAGIGKAGTLM